MINFKNINLKFNQKTIFDDFNFSIKKGEKVVIFGKSGVGKSTLLNLILGFQQPDSGEIFFHDQKISPATINKIRSQIAYVDQDVMIGKGKVRDLIKEYFSFKTNQQIKLTEKKLKTQLEKFELDPALLDKDIDQLSGGERQRLALSIAILLDRPVMILDEVTSALDPASKKMVINQLIQHQDITLVVITHDQEWQKIKKVKIFDFKEKKWVQ